MQEPDTGGRVAAAISNAMVGLIADTTGRGPTKARTTIGRDHVLVMLHNTLTKGERRLAQGGFGEDVLHVRHRFQEVMRPKAMAVIEELVGRRVVAFMSDNHLDPDVAAEVFVLEAPVDGGATQLEEAETSG